MKQIIVLILVVNAIYGRPHARQLPFTWNENFSDGITNNKNTYQINNKIDDEEGDQSPVTEDSLPHTTRGFYLFLAPDRSSHLIVHYFINKDGYQVGTPIVLPKLKNKLQGRSEITPKIENENSHPQSPTVPLVLNATNAATANNTNTTSPEDFPDRLGTPAIITLQGSYG